MSTFTAIVTSHAFERGLYSILGQLRYQTRRPDETLVYFSGEGYDLARLRERFPEAKFSATEDKGDWGHFKRACGVEESTGDFLGFFNDDDIYDRTYVEKMMNAAGSGSAYCNWSAGENCGFHLGSSTSGNFIVSSAVAKDIGYPATLGYASDGEFINAIARCTTPAKVEENLYSWNALER